LIAAKEAFFIGLFAAGFFTAGFFGRCFGMGVFAASLTGKVNGVPATETGAEHGETTWVPMRFRFTPPPAEAAREGHLRARPWHSRQLEIRPARAGPIQPAREHNEGRSKAGNLQLLLPLPQSIN
jgi:GMP synthase-like glutamine amidotransferase